jgi:predicted cupin superfamily sugar epimerase
MNDPDKLIEKLKMVSHPEGGYFSESFRSENNNVSLIYYLLKKNQRSHWHRLKKNEILHFYDGDPLNVYISKDGQSTDTKILGKNIDKNELMHLVVNSGFWFSMKSSGVYSFIGCTVAPGFNYTDFELAPPDWEPKKIKI